MQELNFINGQLTFQLLEGAAIIDQAHDGIDYHVVIKLPIPDYNEGEPNRFAVLSTKNYATNNPEFSIDKYSTDKDARKVCRVFQAEVKTEGEFKAKFPKEA